MFDFDIDYLFEGEQADAYKAKKEQEKKDAKKADEDHYIKRYGERDTRTRLGDKDSYPGTKNNDHTTGSVNHMHVRDSKTINAYQKYDHNKKHTAEFEKAHQAVAKDRSRREFERDWGDPDNAKNLKTKHQFASAADAKARHDRRHPSKESVLEDLMENDIHFLDIMSDDI